MQCVKRCFIISLVGFAGNVLADGMFSEPVLSEFNRGNFEPCIVEMTALISKEPVNDAAFYERARCYFLSADDSNDYDKYVGQLSLSLGDVKLAEAAAEQEMYARKDRATADASQAILLNPRNANAYNVRGLIKSTRGTEELAQSFADFDKAIALQSNFLKPYFNRAAAHFRNGNYDAAIADYSKVLEIDPSSVWAQDRRVNAIIAKNNGKPSHEVFTELNKLITLTPYNDEFYLLAGQECFKFTYAYECVDFFQQYTQAKPNSFDAYLGLARANNAVEVYYSLENQTNYWKNAATAYLQAIKLKPDYFNAYAELVDLYLKKLDEKNQALAIATQAVKAMPTKSDAYVLRGQNLLISGDSKQSMADFNRAIELNVSNSEAYIGRGDVYAMLQDNIKAIADYDRAISLDGQNGQALVRRGMVFSGQQQFQKAIDDFSAADKLNVTCAKSYRGNVYTLRGLITQEKRDTGNFNKASADLLSDDASKCYVTHYLLAQMYFAQGFKTEAKQRFEYALARFKKGSEAQLNEIITAKSALAQLQAGQNVATAQVTTNTPRLALNDIVQDYKNQLPNEGLRLIAEGVFDYSVAFDHRLRFNVERVGFGNKETYVIVGVKEDGSSFGFDIIYDERFIARLTDTTLEPDAQYGYTANIRNEGNYAVLVTNFYLPHNTNIRQFQVSPRGSTTSNIHWLVFKK
jgi:tetratricopeptide (TPR) repeat protein